MPGKGRREMLSMCQALCGQRGWLFIWATKTPALCLNALLLRGSYQLSSGTTRPDMNMPETWGSSRGRAREDAGNMGRDGMQEQQKSSENKTFLAWQLEWDPALHLQAEASSQCSWEQKELWLLPREFREQLGRIEVGNFLSQKLGEPCTFWTQTAYLGSLKTSAGLWKGHLGW